MKFAEFQDSEPHLEGLVDCNRRLLKSETKAVVGEDAHTLTLRFARQLLTLYYVGQEPDISVLGLILTGLAVDRVVHEFEELLLHLGVGAVTEIGVLRDVGFDPARFLELDDVVDLGELQHMVDVEFEVQVLGVIVVLVEETG